MGVGVLRVAQVKVPVTDLERSHAWYRSLLDLQPLYEFVEEGVLRGVALIDRDAMFLISLRDRSVTASQPDLRGSDPFALLVGSVETLEQISRRCDHLGFAHSGIQDRGENWILDVPDPDGTVIRFLHFTGDLDRFLGVETSADGPTRFYDRPRLPTPPAPRQA